MIQRNFAFVTPCSPKIVTTRRHAFWNSVAVPRPVLDSGSW